MTPMSKYEKASVEHRIDAIKELIYALGDSDLDPIRRAARLTTALGELRELSDILAATEEFANYA